MSSCHIAPPKMVDNPTPVGLPNSIDLQEYKTAYFASGCFWCVEAIYESVYGVKEVISGYAGGTTVNPNYQQIGTGRTGHAETVEVYYDPSKVDFKTLLAVFLIPMTNDKESTRTRLWHAIPLHCFLHR